MTRILSLFVMFMLFGVLAFAQNRVVTGKVIDKDGNSVPFASIKVRGSQAGISADANGNYTIRVKDGDVLQLSGSGFKPTDVVISGQSTISSVMEKNSDLTEVVVTTALGQRVKSNAIGYAVSTVRTNELNQAKVVNLQNGLSGKVAGLSIKSINSSVFGDTRITLRGIRSLTGNNQPLLVVDGIQVSLNVINTISPLDIADVTILKSNSAAILYGQEGTNGAILVTTKKGSRSKPTINFGSTVQFEKISLVPELQHEYGPGETEDANGLPIYDFFTNNSFGPRYDGKMVPLGRQLENGAQQMVPYKDLGNERFKFFNTGVTLQNDFSLAGGDDKSRYYLSFQDANVKGTMPNDQNRRNTFRVNASRDFSRLTTSFNFNYSLSNYDVVSQNRGGFDDIYTSVIKTGGNVPLTSYKDYKNNPYATVDGYYNYYGLNPYMLIDIDRNKGRFDNLIASTDLAYKISNSLSLNLRVGTTVRNNTSKTKQGAIDVSPFTIAHGGSYTSSKASVTDFSSNENRLTSDVFLTYRKQFGKIAVDALVGNNVVQRQYKQLSITGNNLVIPTLFNVSNGTGTPIFNELNFKIRTMGNYGKVGFGFDNKVYAEVAGRNDVDSRLPTANNSFFYPSANISFVINEIIPALKNSNFINLIKVRGAYAKSGNVNLGSLNSDFQGAYQLAPVFTTSGTFPFGSQASFTTGDALKDPNIKPEFVTTNELGLEMRFLKNKISFEGSVYEQKNTDQILDVSLPTSTGFTASKVNAAQFKNKGFELDLKLTPLINFGKLSIDVKTNYSYNTNKVTKLYQELNEISIGNLNSIVVGREAYLLKLTDFKRDPQGRVIVDENGSPSADVNRKLYGRTIPKHNLGISPTFTIGGLSLTILAEYRAGNFIYSDIGGDLVFNGIGVQSTIGGRQPFVFPNSSYDDGTGKFIANTSRTTTSGNANFWAVGLFSNNVESLYYSSADFWKIRELSLAYNFPESLLGTQKVVKAASLTLSGRNLFTWVPSSNKWTDPEFSNGTGNAQGVTTTTSNPPSTRIMGVTLNLTF